MALPRTPPTSGTNLDIRYIKIATGRVMGNTAKHQEQKGSTISENRLKNRERIFVNEFSLGEGI